MLSKARLKFLRSLRRKKVRAQEGLLLVEGLRCIEEAVEGKRVRVRELFLSPEVADSPRGRALSRGGLAHTLLEPGEIDALAETESPAGAFALVEDPCRPLAGSRWAPGSLVLVAAEVADPGNLGNLIRTAAGLGADALVATPNTVEPTNPKTVRATAGAIFRLPVLLGTAEELLNLGFRLWLADVRGEPVSAMRARPRRLGLVVGNEPRGIAHELRPMAERAVCVPIGRGVESLNVAVAAGILLYNVASLPTMSA